MSAVLIATSTGFDYHRVAPERPTFEGPPNYVARRVGAACVVFMVAWVIVVLANGVLASFSGQSAEAAGAQLAAVSVAAPELAAATYVARPGDSLWSIADAYRGDVNRDRYLDALINLNGSTSIEVGQAVVLP